MTVPPGAISTIEEMREVLSRGVSFLYLAPSDIAIWKFEILDRNLHHNHGYWCIAKAYDITRGSHFHTGVTCFCIPNDVKDKRKVVVV